MIIEKSAIQALVKLLPTKLEFPDVWPTPDGVEGQWARVMSVDTNNRNPVDPTIRWNMEQAINVPGFAPQYRPDWAMSASKGQLDADPELAAWCAINMLSSYVLAATMWQRRLNPPPVEPVVE